MLDLAQSKNWTAIKLKGTEQFKQKAWLEASLRGIETKGYTPSEKDLAQLQAVQETRTTNQVKAVAVNVSEVKVETKAEQEPATQKQTLDDNERFNQQLQDLIDDKLDGKHIFNLGKPSDVLLNTGFPNVPIELKASKLWEKSQADWHKFDIASAKDLPRALQEPLAVFAYGDKNKSQNVITEIEHDGKKFVVGIHFAKTKDGLQINDVRGFFPKDNHEWINWIAQDKALYLDKEKVQTLINQQRTNLAEVKYLDLNLIDNLVKNFENVNKNLQKTNNQGKYTQPAPSLSSITINHTQQHGNVNQSFGNFGQVQSWYQQAFSPEYIKNNPNTHDKTQITVCADNVPDEVKTVDYVVPVGAEYFNPHEHSLEQTYIHEYQEEYGHFGIDLQEMLSSWEQYDKIQEAQSLNEPALTPTDTKMAPSNQDELLKSFDEYEMDFSKQTAEPQKQETQQTNNNASSEPKNNRQLSQNEQILKQHFSNIGEHSLSQDQLNAIENWRRYLSEAYKDDPDFIAQRINDFNNKIPDIASGKFELPKVPDNKIMPAVETPSITQSNQQRTR